MTDTLKPRDGKDVEDAVRWAVAEGKPLEIVGHGSKRAIGRSVQTDMTLDLSALSGVTDQLIKGARLALERDLGAETVVQELKARHRAMVSDLVPEGPVRQALFAHINAVLAELQAFYVGVHNLGELTPRTLDAISGMGERISFEIVAAAMNERGVPARSAPAGRLREWLLEDPQTFRSLFLPALVAETGGELIDVTRGDIEGAFLDVLSRFGRRYVLSYTPTGVPEPGWHPIEVLLKDKSLTVTARRGYQK